MTLKCVVCGLENKDHVLYLCDRTQGGPWCRDHFMEATGCTEESHGEGCITAVFEEDASNDT